MTQQVPITSVKTHPRNPHRGDVETIKESLAINGQYKSILVQKSTKRIIAGNHTWKAAKELGWDKITVTFIDVNDDDALRILLADNKAFASGRTNEQAAMALLASMNSLEGTGYTAADLNLPAVGDMPMFEESMMPDAPAAPTPEEDDSVAEKRIIVQVGEQKATISETTYTEWRETLPKKPKDAVEDMLTRAGLISREKPTQQPAAVETGQVAISKLIPYPGNPREGDIGMIMGLLEKWGQTREIVVNKSTMHVLAGNQTLTAAKQLGWTSIRVSWVDVDKEGEKRIVLVDNRSAELGTDDKTELGEALASLGSVEGTGYELDDLYAILSGNDYVPAARRAGVVTVRVGSVRDKVKASIVGDVLNPGTELVEFAALVGLDPDELQYT